MTTMRARTLSGPHISFGFLLWWTIAQGIYERDPLVQSAGSLPKEIQDALTGAKERNAWERATYLKIGTLPAIEHGTCKIHYTTRDIDDTYTRLLVREIVDNADVTLKIDQIAQLKFANGHFGVDFEAGYWDYKDEADHIIYRMRTDFNVRIGKIDDNKVRNALLGWMDKRHRITARGSGGVYYIPSTPQSPNWTLISSEINNVREWLFRNGLGTLTCVELVETQTTTRPDFLELALSEVSSTLDDIETKLGEYKEKTGMNDGSRMEAAKSQVNKAEALLAKIDALEEALGDKLGPVKTRVRIVQKKASNMHVNAKNAVDVYRIQRGRK